MIKITTVAVCAIASLLAGCASNTPPAEEPQAAVAEERAEDAADATKENTERAENAADSAESSASESNDSAVKAEAAADASKK